MLYITRCECFLVKYSLMSRAAAHPSPIAEITVTPQLMSPPANTPGNLYSRVYLATKGSTGRSSSATAALSLTSLDYMFPDSQFEVPRPLRCESDSGGLAARVELKRDSIDLRPAEISGSQRAGRSIRL